VKPRHFFNSGAAEKMKQQQRGISFVGFVFVGVVLAFFGLLTIQVIPTLIEFQNVSRAAAQAAAGGTVGEVKAMFDKRAQIDNIQVIAGKDLEVTTDGDRAIVSFAYNREIHLVGPAFLLLKYQGKTK
jgi:hypothetical protein